MKLVSLNLSFSRAIIADSLFTLEIDTNKIPASQYWEIESVSEDFSMDEVSTKIIS